MKRAQKRWKFAGGRLYDREFGKDYEVFVPQASEYMSSFKGVIFVVEENIKLFHKGKEVSGVGAVEPLAWIDGSEISSLQEVHLQKL